MQRLLLLSRRATAATLPRSVASPASASAAASSFSRPAPPKLPPSEQAEFERLQRDAAVSSAFQPSPEQQQTPTQDASAKTSAAAGAAEPESDVNVGMFRGAKPEFEGDTNPRTGEVGGPKNEPLRWGEAGDWSYNGRVTDF